MILINILSYMRRYATMRRSATLKTKVFPRSVPWENFVF